MPQTDKIKYFNFLLENEINFTRDETGNYVVLVKVLNPAFYGGTSSNVNQSQKNIRQENKKQNSSRSTERGKEDGRLRADKKKSGKNSKSLPKNEGIIQSIDNKKFQFEYLNNSGSGSGNNSKKKKSGKSKDIFEKEKIVSYKNK